MSAGAGGRDLAVGEARLLMLLLSDVVRELRADELGRGDAGLEPRAEPPAAVRARALQ